MQLSALEEKGQELVVPEPSVESQVETAQMKQLFTAAIASLPEPYRSVYEMRDLQNLGGTEVARKLHITTAAMKSRLHRARALVRQQLDATLLRSGS